MYSLNLSAFFIIIYVKKENTISDSMSIFDKKNTICKSLPLSSCYKVEIRSASITPRFVTLNEYMRLYFYGKHLWKDNVDNAVLVVRTMFENMSLSEFKGWVDDYKSSYLSCAKDSYEACKTLPHVLLMRKIKKFLQKNHIKKQCHISFCETRSQQPGQYYLLICPPGSDGKMLSEHPLLYVYFTKKDLS